MKNLKVSQQIGGGFTVVVIIFTIVTVIAYLGLSRAKDGFVDYQEIALDANLNSLLLSTILKSRTNVKSFLISNSIAEAEEYATNIKEIHSLFAQAKVEISNPQRASLIEKANALLKQYQSAFGDTVEIINQRNQLIQESLNPSGTKMRKSITQILLSAYKEQDTEATYLAAIIQESLLLGRLYYAKYLKTNKENDFEFAMLELEKKLGKSSINLEHALQNPVRRKLFFQFKSAHAEYVKAAIAIQALVTQRNEKVLNYLDIIGPKVVQLIQEVKLSVIAEQDKLGPELQESNRSTVNAVLLMFFVAIGLAIFFGTLVTRGIVRPMSKAVSTAELLANGNLTIDLIEDNNGTNEVNVLLLALKKTIENLRLIVNNMSSASDSLNTESSNLSSITKNTRVGTNEQLQMIDQISLAMSQMAITVQEVAGNAVDASRFATKASDSSREGQQIAENTIRSICQLENEMALTSTSITRLASKADDIGSILDVIKGIADQTNLLALNAAIEAARAGEQGRGFAVVADEVRGLAQRTQDATQEIQTLIESLQAGSKEAVVIMEKSKNIVNQSVEEANKSGQALSSILDAVEKINSMNTLIASAAEQQSTTAIQINTNIVRVTAIAKESVDNVDLTISSSKLLSKISSDLEGVVKQFKI